MFLIKIFIGIVSYKCDIINKGDLYIKNNLKTNICEIVGKDAFLKCFIFNGPLIISDSITTKTIETEKIEIT